MTIETKISANGRLTLKDDGKRSSYHDVIHNLFLYTSVGTVIKNDPGKIFTCTNKKAIAPSTKCAYSQGYEFVDENRVAYFFGTVEEALNRIAKNDFADWNFMTGQATVDNAQIEARGKNEETSTNAEVKEADVEDYAVTTEAQDVATNTEIELATKETKQAPAIVEAETDGSEEDDDTEEFIAVIPTDDNEDDDDNHEPEILNADIFNNLYQSPHAERFSSRTIKLGDDALYFNKQKLSAIYREGGLSLHFKSGKMQFRSNGRVIARDKVAEIYMNSQIAIEQGKTFAELLKATKVHDKGFFEAWIGVTFANNKEHHISRCFDKFNDAKNFVDEVRKIFADSPVWATVKVNKQCGHIYYRIKEDGSEYYDLPNVEFFKDYTREEIQNRIDQLRSAFNDNKSFGTETDDEDVRHNLFTARNNLKETRDLYEFALREVDFKLPTGNLEVNNSADAFKLIAPYFPKGLEFVKAGKWLNNEDTFTFADKFNLFFLNVTCSPDNRSVVFLEVIDNFASGSKRKPLTVTVNDATELKTDERNLADSLARAMKIALENIQTFCQEMLLTAANREMQLYNICSEALRDLRLRQIE